MSYLVRKIKISKLEKLKEAPSVNSAEADMATVQLKTDDNALSTWEIQEMGQLDDAVLAIATTSSKIEDMGFVLIEKKLLLDQEISVVENENKTPMKGLEKTHRDISDLTYERIGILLKILKAAKPELIRRYGTRQLEEMVIRAYKEEKIDLSKASKNARKNLEELVSNC